MGDAEGALPPSKKRVAGRELSRDNPDLEDDAPEQEIGTFQKASNEVLATRRILKVRRNQPASAPSSNPFAGIHLVPPTDSNPKTTSPTGQPHVIDDKAALEEQEATSSNNEKTEEVKVTESGALLNEPNSTEENKRISGDVTDELAAEGDNKISINPVEEGNPAGINKKADDSGKEIDTEASDGTDKGRLETEKEAGGETEKGVAEKNDQETRENTQKGRLENDQKDTVEPAAPLSSFQQLSGSQNAFTGFGGTGFSSSSFSFGSISKEGSAFGTTSGSLSGFKNENSLYPFSSIGNSNNGTSLQPLGNVAQVGTRSGLSGISSMQEVPTETGEENEKAVFTADAVLFEYFDGRWKERGKGELKVNITSTGAEKARLVMRARGNYRLILNASLYPDMSLTNMEKRGITFACVNSEGEGKGGLTTFALKFKESLIVEEFRGAVTAHKGKVSLLKTPENSPKASED